MSVDILTEVRRRLDVSVDQMPDPLLQHFIDSSTEVIDQYVPSHRRAGSAYKEGVIQLTIKVVDTSTRGTVSMDPSGEYMVPSPSATAGLVRSVWGLIGPLAEPGFA